MPEKFNFEVVPIPNILPDSPLTPNISDSRTILVVDDEPLIADTLVAILRSKSYTASAAYNGEAALKCAVLSPPDILITDVMMPGMNGIDLAVKVKDLIPYCRVMLFSGHAHLGHLLEDPRCTVHEFPLLPKPIHPDELLAQISRLCQPVGSAA